MKKVLGVILVAGVTIFLLLYSSDFTLLAVQTKNFEGGRVSFGETRGFDLKPGTHTTWHLVNINGEQDATLSCPASNTVTHNGYFEGGSVQIATLYIDRCSIIDIDGPKYVVSLPLTWMHAISNISGISDRR